jgi:hypothetical protein
MKINSSTSRFAMSKGANAMAWTTNISNLSVRPHSLSHMGGLLKAAKLAGV